MEAMVGLKIEQHKEGALTSLDHEPRQFSWLSSWFEAEGRFNNIQWGMTHEERGGKGGRENIEGGAVEYSRDSPLRVYTA